MLEKSIKTVLGEDVPHQKCIKHMLDNVKRTINYPSLKTHCTKLRKQLENRAFVSQEKISELKALEDEITCMEELLSNVREMLYDTNKDESIKILKR